MPTPRPGRPRRTSRRTIEEAATELFLEQGYAATTVEQITARAGVSRASYFNYFPAKSDLLWLDADESLDALEAAITASQAAAADGGPVSVRALLDSVAAGLGPERIPLVLSQAELLGTREELLGSGAARVARLATLLTRAVSRARTEDARPRDDGAARLADAVAGQAVASAVVAGWMQWATGGTRRGTLRDSVRTALDLLAEHVPALIADPTPSSPDRRTD